MFDARSRIWLRSTAAVRLAGEPLRTPHPLASKRKPTFAQMRRRPEFRATLDLRQYEVAQLRIIQPYQQKDWVECGMPGKHAHKKGCFVGTPDNLITNIGHQCAESHLGDGWMVVKRRFEDREKDRNSFETVEAFLKSAPVYLERIEQLRNLERGTWWLDKCQLALERLPIAVRNRLRDMSRSGNGAIWDDRSADTDDWGPSGLGFRKSSAGARIVGRVNALDGANRLVFIKARSELELIKRYASFASPHEMKRPDRQSCARFSKSIDQVFARVEHLVADGQRFFSQSNLMEVARLAQPRDYGKVLQIWKDIANLSTAPR